jgi:hypothetical protein
VGSLLQDLELFLIALFFAIGGLPLKTCGGLFPSWLFLGVFWIWALLSGLAPFLDLRGF